MHSDLKAVSLLVIGIFCISINDAILKLLSDSYALHQLIFIRALIGLLIIVPPILFRQGITVLRTSTPGLHALRGVFIVLANLMFFTGLATLPLAEASAVVFTAPVLITIFSYYFLREQISIWRWIAVSIGLVGMICVVQPFGSQIEIAYLWPFGAAIVYAGFIITTRFLGRKDSTESLAIYSIVAFLIISIAMGLIMGDGRFTGTNNPGLEFLLREWHWSLRDDLWPITMIGFLSAVIALAMSAAYRASEASFLAPFEYINLPLVLLWGYLVFGDLPNWLALLGISMIILGGMIMLSKDSGRTITRPL